MNQEIIKIESDDYQAQITVSATGYQVESDQVELKRKIEEVLADAFTVGIECFDSPSEQAENEIAVRRRVVQKGDPDFILALIDELKISFPKAAVYSKVDKKEIAVLRNRLAEKLKQLPADQSLQPDVKRIIDNLDKLNLAQIESVLNDLEGDPI